MEKNQTEHKNELEKLKEEILNEVKAGKEKKIKIEWQSPVVTGVLIVLVVFSLIQAAQAVSILNKVKNGAIKPASAASNGTSAPAAVPANLQNLPNMVGGC